MLNIATTPVARSITLDLRNEESGETIREASIRIGRIPVAEFLNVVLPNQRIEHLRRREMLAIPCGRSSLFFSSVHAAYAAHYALGLRPEVLMYLVNTVVAETVRRHTEDYRALFTTKASKVDIHIRHDGLVKGDPDSPWNEAIGMFDEALRQHVPSEIMNYMLPDFTTADSESNMASLVSFMDSASRYYTYGLQSVCGIPRVVLFGEASDYRKLVTAATKLAECFQQHLAAYFANLIPVLETIAEAAEGGQTNEAFWGQLYKREHMSGGDRFSGWISSFLWYVHNKASRTRPSPLVVKRAELADWRKIDERNGIASGSEPSHVSRAPYTWHYLGQDIPMGFVGGVLGVEEAEGALTPALSWGVLESAESQAAESS